MKTKTLMITVALAILAGCGGPSDAAPAAPTDPVAVWTAAVRAEDWEGATALMAGETAPWLRIMKATAGIAPWQTTTVVEGPTPVDGGQQYGLHWYREPTSPEHQHRCSLIVLDAAGKIHATDKFVGCGQFEALK